MLLKINSEIKRFNKDKICLGSDILPQEEGLFSEHILIEKIEKDQYVILNNAHDPFLTLNGHPFGKKPLKVGDVIEVGSTKIVFLGEEEEVETKEHLLEDLIKRTEALPPAKKPLSVIEEEPEISVPIQQEEPAENKRKSLPKNIKEVESVREKISEEHEAETPNKPTFFWKKLAWATGLITIICALIAANFYFIMSEKIDVQEVKAAQTMADAAMALMNAQLQHQKPSNQNWSNPEFLKENLLSILPSNHEPLLDFDGQGKFDKHPYILRIYTSSDSSQFLIIAQPAPTLFQWLIPKTTLLVDSRDMTIRKTKDLRSLNRLLVNPNILDDADSLEISSIVQLGDIIPPADLADSHPEFAPPKELAFVRHGAENYIYNAPRYHKFNEKIVQKASQLSQNPDLTQNIAPLLQEIAVVSKLHDMVLFAPKGLDEALMVQKGLMPYAPREGFLVGYLSVDPNSNAIANSHLVLITNQFGKSLKKEETSALESNAEGDPPSTTDPTSVGVNIKHPLYILLSNLYTLRQKELCAHHDEIISLFTRHTQKGALNFSERLQPLLNQYEQKCKELQAKAEETLLKLYQEYVENGPKFPPSLFIAYVEAAGVENFIHDNIKIQAKLSQGNISSEELMEKLRAKITESKELIELDQSVEEAAIFLTPYQFPDQEELHRQQNKMRNIVIQKLEQILLFPNPGSVAEVFQKKNRWIIFRILKNGHITDQDEREFYLNEFDNIALRERKKD